MRNLPLTIIRTLRWQLEVTFEEAPAHLGGIEHQCQQQPDPAVLHAALALLGVFSVVTSYAHQLLQAPPLPVKSAAWCARPILTFAATLPFTMSF